MPIHTSEWDALIVTMRKCGIPKNRWHAFVEGAAGRSVDHPYDLTYVELARVQRAAVIFAEGWS